MSGNLAARLAVYTKPVENAIAMHRARSPLRRWLRGGISKEAEFLSVFDRILRGMLDECRRTGIYIPISQGVGSELLGDLSCAKDAGMQATIMAYAAAELDRNLIAELTTTQKRGIAERLDNCAKCFMRFGLHGHALKASQAARDLWHSMGHHEEVDEADYRINSARWRMQPIGLKWFGRLAVYLFGGFGYRPYRLVYAIILVNLLVAALYKFLDPALPLSNAAWQAINGYFSVPDRTAFLAKGFGEKLLIIMHAFFALIANSTLLALLVKRWFRG